jgi:putative DNA primase/helicase
MNGQSTTAPNKRTPPNKPKSASARSGFAGTNAKAQTVETLAKITRSVSDINGPFVLDKAHGLYFVEGGKREFVCAPIHVKGIVVDTDGKNPGYLICFNNLLGQTATLAIPLEVVSRPEQMLAMLTRHGFAMDTDNLKGRSTAIKLYFQFNCPVDKTFVHVENDGWESMPDGDEVYVLGNNIYGKKSSQYVAVQAEAGATPSGNGDRDAWFKLIRPLAHDYLAVLAVIAALSAPLLKPLNFGTLALFFVGRSSTGKTILLRLLASLFGTPNSLLTWEGTDNGIEAQALRHRDKPMVTDEVGQAKGKQFGALSYRLMNPASKQRATSTGKAAEIQQTRTVIISAGEVPPLEHMADAGETAKQGQVARLVTVPVDQKYGVWSNLDGHASGADKSHHVLAQLQTVYGCAGRNFCKRIAPEIGDIAQTYGEVAKELAQSICPESELDAHDGVPNRVLQNFVLFAFTGLLAIEKGILPWSDKQVMHAAKLGFSLWLTDYKQRKPAQESELLAPARLFFQSQRSTKFKPLRTWADSHDGTVAGFEHVKRNGERYFLVYPSYFVQHLCGDHPQKKVLDALRNAGFLELGPRGVPTQQISLPASNNRKSSFYVIRQSILHD